jgi:hypothetical protein
MGKTVIKSITEQYCCAVHNERKESVAVFKQTERASGLIELIDEAQKTKKPRALAEFSEASGAFC